MKHVIPFDPRPMVYLNLLLKAGGRKTPYGHTSYQRRSASGKMVTVQQKGVKPTEPQKAPDNEPHLTEPHQAQHISDTMAAHHAPAPGITKVDEEKHSVVGGWHKDAHTGQQFTIQEKKPKTYKTGDLVTPNAMDYKRIAEEHKDDPSLEGIKKLTEHDAMLHYKEHEGRIMRVVKHHKDAGYLEVESVEPEDREEESHAHFLTPDEVSPVELVKPSAHTEPALARTHKYIRREGTKGNYKYIYEEPSGRHVAVPEEVHLKHLKEEVLDVPEGTPDAKVLKDFHDTHLEEQGNEWQAELTERDRALEAKTVEKIKGVLDFHGILEKAPEAINDFDAKMSFVALHQMKVLKIGEKGPTKGMLGLDVGMAEEIAKGRIPTDDVTKELVGRMRKMYPNGKIEMGKGVPDSYGTLLDRLAKQVHAYNEGDRGAESLLREGRAFLKENKPLVEAVRSIEDKLAKREAFETSVIESQGDDKFEAPKGLVKTIEVKGKKVPLKLMPFQNKLINFMGKVKKGINGADTGMGKTLQGITFGLSLNEKGMTKGTIIFADPGVMGNWQDEIGKFVEGGFEKHGLMVSGSRAERRAAIMKELGLPLSKRKRFYVLPMTLLTDNPEAEEVKAEIRAIQRFAGDKLVLFDEATALKNQYNNTAKNAAEVIKTNEYAITLNADPMPNNLMELWAQIEMFHPGALPKADAFAQHFMEEKTDEQGKKHRRIRPEAREALVRLIKPYVYMKFHHDPDVAAYLPKRAENQHGVTMRPDQMEYYQKAQADSLEEFLGTVHDVNDTNSWRGLVLKRINYLRQIALSPRTVDEKYTGSSAKLDQAQLILRNHFKKHPGKGAVILGAHTKVYPYMKEQIMKDLGLKESEVMIISGKEGGGPKAKVEYRRRMVKEFNEGKVKVLLIGYASGGRGLNLQKRSNRVIHISDPWNPAAVKQGEARVWRFGNEEPEVNIDTIRIPGGTALPEGSIDDFMQTKLKEKAGLNADVLGDSDTTPVITNTVTLEDVAKMFGTNIDRLNQMLKDRGKPVFDRRVAAQKDIEHREKKEAARREAASSKRAETVATKKATKEARVKKKGR